MCKDLIIPFKNRLNCSTTDNRETRCIIACDDGYDFPIKPRNFDMINDQLLLKCNSSDHMWEDNYIAECSGIYIRILSRFSHSSELILFVNRVTNTEDIISGGWYNNTE